MDSAVRRQLQEEIIAAAEERAARSKWRGFSSKDVIPYCKKRVIVQWAIKNRHVNDELLRLWVSKALSSSKFEGCVRFLRTTKSIPGTWKAVDFCDYNDVMVAVDNRRRVVRSVDRSADRMEKAAHLMRLKQLGFRDAMNYVEIGKAS